MPAMAVVAASMPTARFGPIRVAGAVVAAAAMAPLTAKMRPGPVTVSRAPAAAGPASAEELHVLLDKAKALGSTFEGTTLGTRAL